MSNQYAFYVDAGRCVKCWACEVACKQWNGIPAADVQRRTVVETVEGTFPHVKRTFVSTNCSHCEDPACMAACPAGAISKREEDGAVVVDQEVCIGCQTCVNSCPYGAPQFIEEDKIVQKCDTCRALREAGHEPVCVEACPMRAIEFGEMDDLRAAHPDAVSELPCTEPAATTTPNILIGASRGALLEDFNPVVL